MEKNMGAKSLVTPVAFEALVGHTTSGGIVLGADIDPRYAALRWSAYGAFVTLAVLVALITYRHRLQDQDTKDKDARHVLVWECLVAGLAAIASDLQCSAVCRPSCPVGLPWSSPQRADGNGRPVLVAGRGYTTSSPAQVQQESSTVDLLDPFPAR